MMDDDDDMSLSLRLRFAWWRLRSWWRYTVLRRPRPKPTWHIPTMWLSNEALSAARWNEHIADNLAELRRLAEKEEE